MANNGESYYMSECKQPAYTYSDCSITAFRKGWGGTIISEYRTYTVNILNTQSCELTKSDHMRKGGCEMIIFGTTLLLAGGYGIPSGPTQPGPKFIKNSVFSEVIIVGQNQPIKLMISDTGGQFRVPRFSIVSERDTLHTITSRQVTSHGISIFVYTTEMSAKEKHLAIMMPPQLVLSDILPQVSNPILIKSNLNSFLIKSYCSILIKSYLNSILDSILDSNPILDPVLNPILDPVLNPILDPVLNPILDPVLNPILDPVLNPILDPVLNPILDPVLNPILDLVLNPILDPVLNPILDPVLNPILDPVLNSILDPVLNSILDPVLNPILDPVLNSILDPVLNPILDPVLNPILDPVLNSILDPVLNSILDPVLNSILDPVLNSILDPVLNPILDPVLNSILDPVLNSILDPVLNCILDPVLNHILDPVLNPNLNPILNTILRVKAIVIAIQSIVIFTLYSCYFVVVVANLSRFVSSLCNLMLLAGDIETNPGPVGKQT